MLGYFHKDIIQQFYASIQQQNIMKYQDLTYQKFNRKKNQTQNKKNMFNLSNFEQ
ncbi:hypothetical protein pb186bvf_000160 [Paramecium bursaria]